MFEPLLLKMKKEQLKLNSLKDSNINKMLIQIKESLNEHFKELKAENDKDIILANKQGLKSFEIEKLTLTMSKFTHMLNMIEDITKRSGVCDNIIEEKVVFNNVIRKVTKPFGLIFCVYDQNIMTTLTMIVLALKSKNAILLRPSKDSINTNKFIVNLVKNCISNFIDTSLVSLIEDFKNQVLLDLLHKDEYIDLLIPIEKRNYKDIILNTNLKYIDLIGGACSLYLEKTCDIKKAVNDAIKLKYDHPSNQLSIETVLIDNEILDETLVVLKDLAKRKGILLASTKEVALKYNLELIGEDSYLKEDNDYILKIKACKDIDEAISHINKYSTHTADSIYTKDIFKRDKFMNEVDSAIVLVNEKTDAKISDEYIIGVSNDKLHTRANVGLNNLVTYKYLVYNQGEEDNV